MTEVVLRSLTITAIYGLVTLSLNLQYGLTGLLNFGQSMFFAIGGYAVAISHFQGWPVWVGIILGPIAGAVAGLLIAIPARRLGDHFWGLLTLAVAELFLAVMKNEQSLAGGSFGTSGIPKIESEVLLPILLVVIAVVVYALERIRKSQFGRVIRTAREDSLLVGTTGRDIFRFQAVVMAIGGFIAALAGVAFGHWFTYISPDVFTLRETLDVWAMMIIGGLGNNYGVLFGALVLQGLFVGSRFLPALSVISGPNWALLRAVAVGITLPLVLMLRQEGVFPERKPRYALDD